MSTIARAVFQSYGTHRPLATLLLVANLSIPLMAGTSTATPAPDLTPTPIPTVLGIIADDLNGDGARDIVALTSDGSVCVLFGRGDGGFSTPVCTMVATDAVDVATGHFVAGRPRDILVTEASGAFTVVSVDAPPALNGARCTLGQQCASSFCVDGFCCSTPACGVGEGCTSGECAPLATPTSTVPPTVVPPATPIRTVLVVAGAASGPPGADVTLAVRLTTGGAAVAGVQADIGFEPATRIAAKANGKPDCVVNPAIQKGATAFTFEPNGCQGGACGATRALVLAVDNTDPIPDGSVLFTCHVAIAADATAGTYPLSVGGVIASDPSGGRVSSAGTDGAITVLPLVSPTSTVPATVLPTATPTATIPATVLIIAGSASGLPGADVALAVRLTTGGGAVAGAQADIGFEPATRIAAKANGKPDCVVNPAIQKGATAFTFEPNGCQGSACHATRALVLAVDNTDPIPDGSVLFTCHVAIAADAPAGTYPLSVGGVIASDSSGGRVSSAGTDGAITVLPLAKAAAVR